MLPWLSVLLALLMVSKVPYDTLPKVSRKAIRKEPWKFVFGALAVIVVVVTGGNAIFPLLIAFIAIGIIRYVVTFIRRIVNGRQQFEEEEQVSHSRIDT